MKKIIRTLLLLGMMLAGNLYAQDFVYTPTNPAFGGYALNYNWLMSSAQAQNTITEKEEDESSRYYDDNDALKDFEESLNRQVLSMLSREIVNNQFGEDQLKNGNYELGNYQIEVADQNGEVVISIFDTSTGSQTSITVPNF